jgi:hypothetical protein
VRTIGRVLASVAVLAACRKDPTALSGFHAPDATFDIGARERTEVRAGEAWCVFLGQVDKGTLPIEGSTKQTDVFVAFRSRPELGVVNDLSKTPLRVRMEFGSQRVTYRSDVARGTMVLRAQSGSSYTGEIDVTFELPSLGEGQRRLAGAFRLAPAPPGFVEKPHATVNSAPSTKP